MGRTKRELGLVTSRPSTGWQRARSGAERPGPTGWPLNSHSAPVRSSCACAFLQAARQLGRNARGNRSERCKERSEEDETPLACAPRSGKLAPCALHRHHRAKWRAWLMSWSASPVAACSSLGVVSRGGRPSRSPPSPSSPTSTYSPSGLESRTRPVRASRSDPLARLRPPRRVRCCCTRPARRAAPFPAAPPRHLPRCCQPSDARRDDGRWARGCASVAVLERALLRALATDPRRAHRLTDAQQPRAPRSRRRGGMVAAAPPLGAMASVFSSRSTSR